MESAAACANMHMAAFKEETEMSSMLSPPTMLDLPPLLVPGENSATTLANGTAGPRSPT